jgi:predicted ATPase/class 3 adenylate cyclase
MERTASFGYWLRRRRKALDLTQDELAQRVGCALGTIKKLETDERRPSKQLAERLADLLQIPADERAAFLKAARAELATDQLQIVQPVIETPMAPLVAAHLPAGTVTFLFTDIEGSTQLWAQYPEAMRVALTRHDVLLGAAIETHGGAVFKTFGDAFCAAFAIASDAVSAALAAQRTLQAEDWGATGPLRVRMALHTGMAELRGADYFGHALSRAARILTAGHGGQVLFSAASWELVRDHLPSAVALRDLGAHWLKGLPRPEQIYQLVAPDLPADFPPLATLDRPTTNLPAQTTAFIGREGEVGAVRDLLRRTDVRLVTLTGPGGAGKTRLSLQAAAEMLDDFSNGVWFVNLAPISDSGLVTATIAQALGVRDAGEQPLLESLKSYLHGKRILLLLDNFEQVVDTAPAVAELLAAAPGLKVLVTSRMPLRLTGEREFSVPPLSLPDPKHLPPELERLTQYEAVRLFIERAQAVKADFAVTNENAAAVAEICSRLDGLPLAIELAAARIKLFPAQALLGRLAKPLKLLTGGAHDLPSRQQTIRNTIDWSYQLLDEGEKRLFARLAVFVDGSTLEAAEAVCNAEADLPMDVVDGIAALLDQSLLQQEEGVEGGPRLVMLQTIREYALERLEQSGEAEALRQQHAAYFLALAEAAAPQLYGHPQSQRWLDLLEQEHDNLRAALRWTIEWREADVAVRLSAALGWFWGLRGDEREGLSWLDATLTLSSTHVTPARAWALFHASLLDPDLGRGSARGEESLALFRKLGDTIGIARVLPWLALIVFDLGNTARAEALFAESVERGQELGDPVSRADAMFSLIMLAELRGDDSARLSLAEEFVALRRQVGEPFKFATALNMLGETARLLGDDDRALAAFEEALGLSRALRNKGLMASILTNMGFVVQRQGQHTRAAALFAEALAVNREMGFQDQMALVLAGLAGVAGAQAQPERAARLLGAVEAWYETNTMSNVPMYRTDRADYERIVAAVRAQLDEEAFAAAWAAGRSLTLEQAIAYALEESDVSSVSSIGTAATLQ